MREQMDFKYGAADLYFVCIMRPESLEGTIKDTDEVLQTAWIPLSDIDATNDETSKYRLFPNAH